MAVKFTCPHCKKNLSVKDDFAGKRGSCPACKKMIVVPNKATTPAAAAKKQAPDMESLVAETLIEQKKEEPQGQIEVTCSYCDHVFQVAAELGGKQAPCPDCKRIVKVPMPKSGAADWRAAATGPSGALRQTENLEGQWGVDTARGGVSREALEEAGALPSKREPLPRGRKVAYAVVAFLVLVGAGIGGWMWYVYYAGRYEKLGLALADAAFPEGKPSPLPPDAQVELHRLVGEYCFVTENKDAKNRSGLQRLQAARVALNSCTDPVERLALVRSLLRTQVELNLPAGEIGPCFTQALPRDAEEAKRLPPTAAWDVVREGSRAILARDGTSFAEREKKIVSCVQANFPAAQRTVTLPAKPAKPVANPEKPEDEKPEPPQPMVVTKSDYSDQLAVLAIVGQELVRAGQTERAKALVEEHYLSQLTDELRYPGKDDPVPYPLQVLLLMLGQPVPKPEGVLPLAKLEALIRAGDVAAAEKALNTTFAAANAERLVAIVYFLDTPKVTAEAAEKYLLEAGQLAEKFRREAGLYLPQLVQLAVAHGKAQDAEKLAAALLTGSERGRARLALLRQHLRGLKDSPADSAKAEPLKADGSAYYVALAEIARHNAQLDAAAAYEWAEGLGENEKPFAGIGVALGMNDKRSAKK
jgi:hypothetical protein